MNILYTDKQRRLIDDYAEDYEISPYLLQEAYEKRLDKVFEDELLDICETSDLSTLKDEGD